MNEVTFGSRLKELRRSRKLTQAGLGKILYVSHDTISIWEHNRAEPSLDSLKRIAIVFNVTTDYLLDLKIRYETKTHETAQPYYSPATEETMMKAKLLNKDYTLALNMF